MRRRPPSIVTKLVLTAALCAAVLCPLAAAEINQQRELFRSVFAAVERGEWEAVTMLSAIERQQLESYLLWPDLRAAYLRTTLRQSNNKAIEAFLDQYGMLKPARD